MIAFIGTGTRKLMRECVNFNWCCVRFEAEESEADLVLQNELCGWLFAKFTSEFASLLMTME